VTSGVTKLVELVADAFAADVGGVALSMKSAGVERDPASMRVGM
jgi:hypothetical protein